MTVARCRAAHYRVPREVWWPEARIGASLYEISHIELVTLEIESADGVTGFGFTYTVGQGGSAVLALLEDEIAPELIGRDPRDAEAIWHELRARLHVHLICTVPHALILEYLPIFERLLEEPLMIRDGVARPSEAPGHGMRFSDDIMNPHRVGAKEVLLR